VGVCQPYLRRMRYSLVIPAHNEADNLPPLLAEICALPEGQRPFEIILVDDASADATAPVVTAQIAAHPSLRMLRLAKHSGQSAAMLAGVKAARSDWVATIDADGENDPADLARMIVLAETSGADLIGGERPPRRSSWSKELGSRLANDLRRRVLSDGCSDSACGLKLFRRAMLLQLPSFDGMHRFLPALVQIAGGQTRFLGVKIRPRRHGRSNYGNLRRAASGLIDLGGVLWLKRCSLAGAVRIAKEEP